MPMKEREPSDYSDPPTCSTCGNQLVFVGSWECVFCYDLGRA